MDRNINQANIAYHNNIRNFSKTPIQSKSRVIAYSPRSNVNSIFISLMSDKIRERILQKKILGLFIYIKEILRKENITHMFTI